jgi:ion channel
MDFEQIDAAGLERSASFRLRASAVAANLFARDRHGLLLLLIIATLISSGLVRSSTLGRLFTTTLLGATIILAARTAGLHRRLVELAAVLVIAALLAIALSNVLATPDVAVRADAGLSALLVLVTPLVISRRLVRRAAVDLESILGALCVYLLLGMFFAFFYTLLYQAGMRPFFAQRPDAFPVDFLYFSFVTITTVGYGDLTPVNDFPRMIAVTEALIGQFYLVTVIAILVSRATLHRSS